MRSYGASISDCGDSGLAKAWGGRELGSRSKTLIRVVRKCYEMTETRFARPKLFDSPPSPS